MLMSSSKLFFFQESSFKLRCDTVIGTHTVLSSDLVGMLMSSSKLFFFQESSFKLRCDTVIGTHTVLCYCHQACCLLYYVCEITSNRDGIHVYLSGCNLNKNFGGSTEKCTDRRTCVPLFIALVEEESENATEELTNSPLFLLMRKISLNGMARLNVLSHFYITKLRLSADDVTKSSNERVL